MSKKDKWVRELTREYGIEDNRVDYDSESGYITIDGRNTVKADYVEEGKSYLKDTSKLEKILRTDYEDVALADYAAQSPVPLKLSQNSEGVFVGGEKAEAVRIKDGKAYVPRYEAERLTSGAVSMTDIAEDSDLRYGKEIEKLLKGAKDEKFDYSLEEDEGYIALKKAFTEAGERAARDALASYSENTGGVANSMAVTAAGGISKAYGEKLAAEIPGLIEAAFNRYLSERDGDLKLADSMLRAKSDYETSKEDALSYDNNEVRKNNEYLADRYEREYQEEKDNYDRRYREESDRYEREYQEEKDNYDRTYREQKDAEEKRRYDEEAAREQAEKEQERQDRLQESEAERLLDERSYSDTQKKVLADRISEAYNFIEKAFVGDEGINTNGISLYLESLGSILPDDIKAAIAKTYGI